MSQPIPLLLITGFLGSGKTSAINQLLKSIPSKKVGLVVNDFGSIVIDEALVEKSDDIITIKNLSGGQIFCSCLSGSFVDSIESMVELNPDYIIAETSGLAKPSPLLEIVSIISKKTQGAVEYRGMLCVIDAERVQTLFAALNAVEEQIMFSDWFLINKKDLVAPTLLKTVVAQISSLRPLAPLYTTEYGVIPEDLQSLLLEGVEGALDKTDIHAESYAGWGVYGRPKTCVFNPPKQYHQQDLEETLTLISSQMLRMKGFILHPDGKSHLLISAVGPHITISQKALPASTQIGLVCIHAANIDGPSLILQTWKDVAQSDAECYEA
jgi:G3E family GTPase